MAVDTFGWITCHTCGHSSPHYCENPACPDNPILTPDTRQAILDRSAAYKAQRAADEERRRLVAMSYARRCLTPLTAGHPPDTVATPTTTEEP